MAGVYRAIERALAPIADAIVAVSPEDMLVGRRVLGQRARLRVIQSGVDTASFTPDGPVAARPSLPLIVCVGRLSEAKGQADAIEALARLPEDSILRLVGDGEDAATLRALAEKRGVSHRVEFVGAVEDPSIHLRAADVVVIPSRWDAQSRVLLEALACGCAIVATAVPGSEAVAGVGEVVARRNPEALAASTRRLLESPDLRADLQAKARRRAVGSYDLRGTQEAWRQLWREAAEWR
jgi:glycosyltransferase involved in cell wall biosynthesis